MARRFRAEGRSPDDHSEITRTGKRPHAIVIATPTADARNDAKQIRGEYQSLGILFEQERRENMRCPCGQQHAGRSAGNRDDDAIREHFSGELAAAGAERDANRGLMRAGGGASEQERGDVSASDEEHETCREAEQRADA